MNTKVNAAIVIKDDYDQNDDLMDSSNVSNNMILYWIISDTKTANTILN